MEKNKGCLWCQKMTLHDGSDTCTVCGYQFNKNSFTVTNWDPHDQNPDEGISVPYCSKCNEEISPFEDYAEDNPNDVNLCRCCWEQVTGDSRMPPSKAGRAALEIVQAQADFIKKGV